MTDKADHIAWAAEAIAVFQRHCRTGDEHAIADLICDLGHLAEERGFDFVCTPTTASARPALRSAATCTSTTAGDHIRALTARHPIKPTSRRCPAAWQPNPGRRSTYRRGDSVQTTGTTSDVSAYADDVPVLSNYM